MDKLKPFTLLYAEDDAVIRKGYTNYFQHIFENVHSAVDGREAYVLYKQHKPDILVLDINMPYINGLKLVEKIREEDKDVKIILLTAHRDEEKLLQAIPLNLVNYLIKPVKRKQLEDTILNIISDLEKQKKDDSLIKLSDTMDWDKDKNILINNDKVIHLTKNEIILMNILSIKPIIHYSLDNILEKFWQYQDQKEMSHNSIRNIIKRLKQKLPKDTIENCYGIGYKLCITD